jgi:polyisoprenoid-binding protein YceI
MSETQTRCEDHPVVTRLVDGTELPAPGRWQIDPGHTELAFIGRHFMLTRVRGRFTGVSGTIEVAEDPSDTTVDVTIDMTSVTSGNEARDEHLRSADFFDVEHYPTAAFSATASGWRGARGVLAGVLTLRGITRPVTLQAEYLGYAADPWGGHRAVFTAAGTVDREDWGLAWNLPLDGGGFVLSREIRLEIELEAVFQPSSSPRQENTPSAASG